MSCYPKEPIVRYTVKKITENHRLCSMCGGTGKTPSGSKCIECKEGVAVHWHQTEIDLMQALIEKATEMREQNLKLIEVGYVVSRYYNVHFDFLTIKTRKREVVEKRQVAHYFAVKYCKNTLYTIGQFFGKQNHATVLHSCKKINDLYDFDTLIRKDIDAIDAIMQSKNNCRAEITKAEIRQTVRDAYLAYIRAKMNQLRIAQIAARDIVQLCDRMNTSNISHHLCTIKAIAVNINQL